MNEKHRGSLDYAESVIDPKNKKSLPYQIGDSIACFMEVFMDEDWSMFRLNVLEQLKAARARAERKGKHD